MRIKKFKRYPVSSGVSNLELIRYPIIDKKKTKIVSIGSCFAREITTYLNKKKYSYMRVEKNKQGFSAAWGRIYNTACIRQIFQYSFEKFEPTNRWWKIGEKYIDPFRDFKESRVGVRKQWNNHKKASRYALESTDILILTLGMTQTWRDKRDKYTFNSTPFENIFDEKIHEFYIRNYEDCLYDLEKCIKILEKYNKNIKIIITVSPIPLAVSFRNDLDCYSSNIASKSTLRAVVDYLSRKHNNIFYFPSYEISNCTNNAYKKDERHLKNEVIVKIMGMFEESFVNFEK